MHYYRFNLADYAASTAHLSNDEDLCYRRLLDLYYSQEAGIPVDTQWVARRVRLAPEVVERVLKDFFTLSGDRWLQDRCEQELSDYRQKAERNRANGRRAATQSVPSGGPVGTQSPASGIPLGGLTNNQKPVEEKNTPRVRASSVPRPEDVPEPLWADWVTLRKVKRAPVTANVLEALRAEAKLAGWTLEAALTECVLRGWQGFKADWVKPGNGRPGAPARAASHMPNMPLGSQACACPECVSYRTKRGGV